MLLLFIIEAVVYLFSLPFVMLSQFLPQVPDLSNAINIVCTKVDEFLGVIVFILTMGGNAFFVLCYRFCLAVLEFIILYWVITRVIDLVKRIFVNGE